MARKLSEVNAAMDREKLIMHDMIKLIRLGEGRCLLMSGGKKRSYVLKQTCSF